VSVYAREQLIRPERQWHDLHQPIFREPLRAKLRKWRLGAIDVLGMSCSKFLPRLAAMTLDGTFSSAETLAVRPHFDGARGLPSASDELDVGTMLAAYRCGLLPAYRLASVKWWAPSCREAIAPDEFRIGGPTRRLLREAKFQVSFDHDFCSVLEACAECDAHLRPKLMSALWTLYQAGYAHSVEVRDKGSHLVGGLYGVALGDVFFAESRFARANKASNIAIAVLHHHLSHWGFAFRTARWVGRNRPNSARVVGKEMFQALLRQYVDRPSRIGRWTVETSLDTYGWSRGLKGLRGAKRRLIPRGAA
jgi:leucyl/phenylalanyl-tRNA--protein transferase